MRSEQACVYIWTRKRMTRDSSRPVSGNLVFVVKIPVPVENDYFPLLYCVVSTLFAPELKV